MTVKEFFTLYGNEVFSLLKIESGSKFNHLFVTSNAETNTTIPKRSANIGLAQFDIRGNTFTGVNRSGKALYRACSYRIRVETNLFNNRLCIITKKAPLLEKSDYLVFGDKYCLYISKGQHNWVTDSKYYRLEQMKTVFGDMQVNSYDIKALMADSQVSYVYRNDLEKTVTSYTGSYENRLHEQSFPLQDYSKELFELYNLNVQSDPKVANNCYYCFSGSRYCSQLGTAPTIAKAFCQLFQVKTESQIKSGLYYTMRQVKKDRKAHFYKMEISAVKAQQIYNNINFDSSMIVEKDNKYYFVIYLSAQKDFDIVLNAPTENLTADIQQYRKVSRPKYKGKYKGKYNAKNKVGLYLKRHNNQFNPDWTEEEKNIAQNILSSK